MLTSTIAMLLAGSVIAASSAGVELLGDRGVVPADAVHGEPDHDHRRDGDPGAVGNLLITTMTRTAPVTQAPMVLIARDRIIRSRPAASVVVRSSRFQCRIMPVWLQVKETKTPTM